MKKYEITDIAHPDNPNLHRIRAVTDLTEDVLAGMLGGYALYKLCLKSLMKSHVLFLSHHRQRRCV